MNNVKIKIAPGIQMFLEYYALFQSCSHIHFHILLDKKIIQIIRPEWPQSWRDNLNTVLKFLFKDVSNVTVLEDEADHTEIDFISENHLLAQEIASTLRIPHQSLLPISESKLFDSEDSIDNYIVMNTKCMSGMDKDLHIMWNNIKNNLFNLFNEYDLKVKIIGERQHNHCSELKWHGTFPIYDDIVNGNINNLEDLTKPDSLSLYDVDCVIENMTMLKKSVMNIHIGEGGGQTVYAHMNNVLSLTRKGIGPNSNIMFSYIKNPKFAINTTDTNVFLNILREKLETFTS